MNESGRFNIDTKVDPGHTYQKLVEHGCRHTIAPDLKLMCLEGFYFYAGSLTEDQKELSET